MNVQPLLDAINYDGVVSGLSHDFYRYPARFSPHFARAAILQFTAPGDTVLDPFLGGGTSLVESLSLGRHGVGIDINQLSVFLARTKTLLMSDDDLDLVQPAVPEGCLDERGDATVDRVDVGRDRRAFAGS